MRLMYNCLLLSQYSHSDLIIRELPWNYHYSDSFGEEPWDGVVLCGKIGKFTAIYLSVRTSTESAMYIFSVDDYMCITV